MLPGWTWLLPPLFPLFPMVSGIKRNQRFQVMSESCQIRLYSLSYSWDFVFLWEEVPRLCSCHPGLVSGSWPHQFSSLLRAFMWPVPAAWNALSLALPTYGWLLLVILVWGQMLCSQRGFLWQFDLEKVSLWYSPFWLFVFFIVLTTLHLFDYLLVFSVLSTVCLPSAWCIVCTQ